MAPTTIVAFWAVTVLLIIVPGPDWAFTLGAAMHGQSVIAAVSGLVVGYAMLTGVVSAGVGALVARTPAAMIALTLIGGCNLMWRGIITLRHPPATAATMDSATAAALTPRAIVLNGIGVSGLNPKALLLFLALLPQFTAPRGPWPVAVQIALLGAIFTVTCAVFYAALGSLARTLLHTHRNAARAMGRMSGIGMLIIGALLIVKHVAQ